MIKVAYDSEGKILRAYDSTIEITGNYILVSQETWNKVSNKDIKVADGKLVLSISSQKDTRCNKLWKNYKAFQTKYVDAQDLTLASLCSAKGSTMGQSIQMWVMGLWRKYYTVKDAIMACTSSAQLQKINIQVQYDLPPYTIRQLNDQAATYLAGV